MQMQVLESITFPWLLLEASAKLDSMLFLNKTGLTRVKNSSSPHLCGNISKWRKSSFHTRVHSCGMKNRASPRTSWMRANWCPSPPSAKLLAICYHFCQQRAKKSPCARSENNWGRPEQAGVDRFSDPDHYRVLPFLQQTHLSLSLSLSLSLVRALSLSLLLWHSAEIMPNRYSLACVGVGRTDGEKYRN